MLYIAPTKAFLEETRRLSKAARREPVAMRCRESGLRARLFTQVSANVPEAIGVRSRSSLDQTERVIFDIAEVLGEDVVHEVDQRLRQEPDEPIDTLEFLSKKLAGRPLIVDGFDELLGRGPHPDLGRTQDQRRRAIHRWLTERGMVFFLGDGLLPQGARVWKPLDALQDVEIRNGAPRSVGASSASSSGNLSLLLTAYLLGDEEVESSAPTEEELRTRIDQLLPESTRKLLRALAVHDRPLSKDVAIVLYGEWSVDSGTRLGVIHESPTGLSTESGWSAWLQRSAAPREIRQIHLELAVEFSRQCNNDSLAVGLPVLEAHRHFVAAGHVDKAKKFVRYGVTLLVDEARRLSNQQEYTRASELYEAVLKGAQDHDWPIGIQLKGYARHYLHFNRALERAETLVDTERGYQEALSDWPGNALFWSRLIRTQFYLGHPNDALATLSRAQAEVKPHALKQTFLIARTVRGLLRHDDDRPAYVLDAMRIWGDYEPDSEFAMDIQERLRERLASAWRVRTLNLASRPLPLFFTRDVSIRVEKLSNDWLAQIREIEVRARGTSPVASLVELETSLCEEAKRLIASFTHELDDVARFRKRRLLGIIDVIASGLDAAAADTTWVFGDLVREQGGLWLRAGGNQDVWYEIEPSLATEPLKFDRPYFAKVGTGSSGCPLGPVYELVMAWTRSENEILDEWRRRLANE